MTINHDFLAHHGVIGQKWGHRRYQNPDGSLTPEGRRHWGLSDTSKMSDKELQDAINRSNLERRYAVAMSTSKTKNSAKNLAKTAFGVLSKTLSTTSTVTSLADKTDAGKQFANLAKIGAEGSKIGQEAFNVSQKTAGLYKHKLANFSDEELKKMVARAELERKYEDEVKNKNLNDTMESVNNILGAVGSVVGITAAGLAIYKTISDMRGN